MALTQQPTSTISASDTGINYRAPLAMVTTLFFMWGFLTCLNDILVPHLKAIFDLNYAEVMLVQFCFFSAYFVFSIPSGKIIERVGYKATMVGGLFTMGLGALLFIPAASVPSFPLFLAALIILAAGITALQVSANPYVAVLGPARTASSRLNLTQAFNSLGTTVAPYLGGLLILGATAAPKTADELRAMPAEVLHAYRLQEASSVKLPYLIIAVALIALGIVIAKIQAAAHSGGRRRPRRGSRRPRQRVAASQPDTGSDRDLRLCGRGSFHRKLSRELHAPTRDRRLEPGDRGQISHLLLGRRHDRPLHRFGGVAESADKNCSRVQCAGRCLLVCTSMLTYGHIAMWTMLLVGLFNSIMFPSIFTLGIEGLGPSDGRSIGCAGDGDCGWRDCSGTTGTSCRPSGTAPRFHPAGDLLPVHLVLCGKRTAAKASGELRQVSIRFLVRRGNPFRQSAAVVLGHAVLPLQKFGDGLRLDAHFHAAQTCQQQVHLFHQPGGGTQDPAGRSSRS